MSVRASTSSRVSCACSGLMYAGVPMNWYRSVSALLSVSGSCVALATPKSMTLGKAVRPEQSPSRTVTSTLDGLRSRWMTPLVCACWTAWHTSWKSTAPLAHEQPAIVAELRDGHAAHQLHPDVRPPRLRRAAIEDARDARVIHQRQRLSLGLEPRDHLARVHPQLDDLERHAPPHRLLLLGQINHAEAALADLAHELVRADAAAADAADAALATVDELLRRARGFVSRCRGRIDRRTRDRSQLQLLVRCAQVLGQLGERQRRLGAA